MPLLLLNLNDTGLYGTAAKPLVLKNALASEVSSGDVWNLPGSMWVQNQLRIGGTPALFLADTTGGCVQVGGPLGVYSQDASSGPTVTPAYALQVIGTAAVQAVGTVTVGSITITNVGTAGSTTYTYYIQPKDEFGNPTTATSKATTTGNATLNSTNYNTVSWGSTAGAYSYDVFQLVGGTYKLVGNTRNLTINDQGGGSASGGPATAATGSLSVAGSLTVAGSPVWTQATLTNLNQLTNGPGYVTGSGTSGQAAYFNGSGSITSSGNFTWNNASNLLSVWAGGAVQANNHDTPAAATLTLGGTNATAITLGKSGVTVNAPGTLQENASRVWTAATLPTPSVTPSMDGTGAVGSGAFAYNNHVHPTDTSRAPTASPTFTGTVTAANLTVTGTFTLNALTLSPSGTATSGTTTFASNPLGTQYSWWNGSSAQTASGYFLKSVPSSAAAGTGNLQFLDANTTERMRLVAGSNKLLIGGNLDLLAAGQLNIGTTTATTILLGSATCGVSVQTELSVGTEIDVPSIYAIGTSLLLGSDNDVQVTGGVDFIASGFASVAGSMRVAQGLMIAGNLTATVTNNAAIHILGGGIKVNSIAGPPSGLTVTNVGTAGTTSYSYYVVALDAFGNKTLAAGPVTTTTGNATLSSVNKNHISWTAVAGTVSYDVLKTNTTTKLGSTTGTSLDDTGQSTTSGYSLPLYNQTADIFTDGFVTGNSGIQGNSQWYTMAAVYGTGCGGGTTNGTQLGGYFIGGDCATTASAVSGDGLQGYGGFGDAKSNAVAMNGGYGASFFGGDGFNGGYGVYGQGGAGQTDTATIGIGTGGYGGYFLGASDPGDGSNNNHGIYAQAGTGSSFGYGAYCVGVNADPGVYAKAGPNSGFKSSVRCDGGGITFTNSTAAYGTTFHTYYVGPENICCAWATFTTVLSGNSTLNGNFCVSSVSISTTFLRVNFAKAMANTNYLVDFSIQDSQLTPGYLFINSKTTSYVEIGYKNSSGTTVTLNAAGYNLGVAIFGQQS